MDKSEIPFLSASALSGLIASREISPVEATEAYLERIDSLDFKFNAYLTVTREMALARRPGGRAGDCCGQPPRTDARCAGRS